MLLHQVIYEQPRAPKELNDRIPRDLDNICMKAMAKNPNWRYATAGDMADDLRRHLQGEPVRAQPIGPGQRLWLWWRKPTIATLSGLAALGFTSLAILAIAFGLRERHNTEILQEALQESNSHLRNAQYQLAESHLSRSLSFCDRQLVGQGMLWLVRSLESAPEHAHGLQRYLRTSLAAWRSQHCELQACLQLPATLRAMAFNPEGTSCIAICANGECLFWETATGACVRRLQLAEREVQAAAISPSALITVSEAGSIRVCDPATGLSQSEPMVHAGRIKFVTVSKDASTLLVGAMDRSASLWQPESDRWRRKQHFEPGKVYSASLSADGSLAVTGSNDGARLWETSSGKILHSYPHEAIVTCSSFSADSAIVATGCIDGSARLWHVASGSALPFQVRHDHTINAVALSGDRQFLLTASEDQSARIWSIASQKPIGSMLLHADAIKSAAFSSMGTTVVTGGNDRSIRIWSRPEQRGTQLKLPAGEWIRSAVFSSDGKLLLTAGGTLDKKGSADLWDAQTGQHLATPIVHADLAWTASFDTKHRRILTASVDGSARVADLSRRPSGLTLKHGKPVHFAASSPDGTHVLTGSDHDRARLWDAANGQPVGKEIDHEFVRVGAFSPKGDLFLTASDDGSLRLWRSADQTQVFPTVDLDALVCASFSHDGRFIIAGTLKDARIYDVPTGRLLDPPARHLDQVRVASFSHDDRKYLTASDDGTVQIWDTQTMSRLGHALVHGNPVNVAVFSPDDLLVLTGCRDGTFRIWDLSVGKVIGPTLSSPGRAVCVAFGADGRRFLTSNSSQSAWLRETPIPLEYDLANIALWVQVLTGTELDDDENIHVLDSDTWLKRRHQLRSATMVAPH
jgi:WD40 repeat protein